MSKAPSRYQLERLWRTDAPELRAAVIDFWLAHGALTDRSAAEQRVAQVVYVALDSDDEIAAVSTVYLGNSPQLRRPMLFFRCFVAAPHRSAGLARLLLEAVLLYFNDEYVSGRQTEAIGVQIIVENAMLTNEYNAAVWEGAGFKVFYIGNDQNGRHQRVAYFDGARL